MAVPTLTPGFTVLSACENATGWSAGTVDTEVFVQGTSSLSGILRTAGLNTRTYTTTTFNATGQHLRMWLNYASIGFLATQALGGIRLFIQDTGGNIGYWYLGGIDTYLGGWVLLTVDMDRAFDSGTANRTIINRVGFALQLTGAPRNATNTWYDYLVYGQGMRVTGGAPGDPIDWAGIASQDALNGYGAIRRINSVYFCNTNIIFGADTGTTNTYLVDDNQIVVFENQPVNATLYKIECQGAATNTTSFVQTNSTFKSASTATRFDLDFSNPQFDILTFNNNQVVNADNTFLKAGQTLNTCTWLGCNKIIPNTAAIQGSVIANSIDTGGAIEFPAGNVHQVTNTTLLNNSRAVELTTAGTYTFNALFFEGNTNDVHNTSGGNITINATNGSDVSTSLSSLGGVVTIVNAKSFTVSNIIANSEVRIIRQSDNVELGGVENVAASPTGINNVSVEVDPDNAGRFRVVYSYGYSADIPIWVVVFNVEYQPIFQNATLRATDGSLLVSQIQDRQYSRGTIFNPN